MTMQLKQYAHAHTILNVLGGSRMYGTHTEDSDTDYLAVYIPPPETIIGLDSDAVINDSRAEKDEYGKNMPSSVDLTLYDVRSFVRLAMKNNPNILEILFAPQENVELAASEGVELLNNAHLFPHRYGMMRFLGYAENQKKGILKKESPDGTWRNRLVELHGYDTKKAMHTMRLFMEADELLSFGTLTFPLKERDLLRSIRDGEYPLEKVLSMIDARESVVKNRMATKNALPDKPRRAEIEAMLMGFLYEHLRLTVGERCGKYENTFRLEEMG